MEVGDKVFKANTAPKVVRNYEKAKVAEEQLKQAERWGERVRAEREFERTGVEKPNSRAAMMEEVGPLFRTRGAISEALTGAGEMAGRLHEGIGRIGLKRLGRPWNRVARTVGLSQIPVAGNYLAGGLLGVEYAAKQASKILPKIARAILSDKTENVLRQIAKAPTLPWRLKSMIQDMLQNPSFAQASGATAAIMLLQDPEFAEWAEKHANELGVAQEAR